MSPRKKSDGTDTSAPKPKRKSSRGKASEQETAGAVTPADAVDKPVIETPASGIAVVMSEFSERYSGRIVVFTLGGQKYGLPVELVQEIQQLVAYTEVPDPMPALVGIVNLRGLVVPLVDLRTLLGMEPHPYGLDTPMIICRSHGSLTAVAVDEVEDVVQMPPGCVQPPSRLQAAADRMLGVCRMDPDLIFLLDLDAVVPQTAAVAGGAPDGQ